MKKYKLLASQVIEYEEDKYRLELVREEILADYKEALSQGDLSENSAYASSKLRLQDNSIELANVQMILDHYDIVDESSINRELVDIGTKVTLTDQNNNKYEFTMVTEGAGSIVKKTISQMSDVGNAIYGKTVGSVVEVKSNSGEVNFFAIQNLS